MNIKYLKFYIEHKILTLTSVIETIAKLWASLEIGIKWRKVLLSLSDSIELRLIEYEVFDTSERISAPWTIALVIERTVQVLRYFFPRNLNIIIWRETEKNILFK